MNTHDKYELPPLLPSVKDCAGTYEDYSSAEMVEYAIAAIEADRQRRDNDQQPFGYFRPEPFGWTDCAATDEGAIALYERPQVRGEPVGWQPIETAPHDEEVLLGWLEWDGAWKMEVSQASWGWSTKTASNISRHGQATHWMPLPDAPQPTEPVKEQP